MPALASRAALALITCLGLGAAAGCDSNPKGTEISSAAAQETQAGAAMQPATPPDENVADPADAAERPQRIADLATLCAALDKDYVDGTLSDYYAKAEMTTQWGRDLRKSGSASIKPARELEAAVAKLDPAGKEAGLASCRTLLEYIDDVE